VDGTRDNEDFTSFLGPNSSTVRGGQIRPGLVAGTDAMRAGRYARWMGIGKDPLRLGPGWVGFLPGFEMLFPSMLVRDTLQTPQGDN
jgi:hypothetical protein